MVYRACNSDEVINPLTHRCITRGGATHLKLIRDGHMSPSTKCRKGQYLSKRTGRCKRSKSRSAKKSAKRSGKKSAKRSGKKSAKRSGKKSAKRSGKKSAKRSGKRGRPVNPLTAKINRAITRSNEKEMERLLDEEDLNKSQYDRLKRELKKIYGYRV
jgi:hypothetical protein